MKIKALLVIFTLFAFQSCKKPNCPDPKSDETTATSINGWSAKTSSFSGDILKVDFPSAQIGYLTGINGLVYKTFDGGSTFTNICPLVGYDYYALDFVSDTTGFIGNNNGIAGGNIYKTTNGGNSWVTLTAPVNIWRCIKFLNSNVGFVGGGINNNIPSNGGKLYRTTDGGQTWSDIVVSNLKAVRSIYFVDDNNGYMSTDQAQLYKTTDGGLTWTILNLNLATSIPASQLVTSGVYFKNSNEGYCLTYTVFYNDLFLMKTMDGGVTWTRVTLPASGYATFNNYQTINFTDANTGYIVGGNVAQNKASILKTIDGGASWTEMGVTASRLNDLSLVNSGLGYAVGLNTTILKSN